MKVNFTSDDVGHWRCVSCLMHVITDQTADEDDDDETVSALENEMSKQRVDGLKMQVCGVSSWF
jgi:hypothetical protein